MLICSDCWCTPGHWACAVPLFQTLACNNLWPWNQSWLFMLGLILCEFIQPRKSFHLCQPSKDCLHFWFKIIVQIETQCNHVYTQADKCMYVCTLSQTLWDWFTWKQKASWGVAVALNDKCLYVPCDLTCLVWGYSCHTQLPLFQTPALCVFLSVYMKYMRKQISSFRWFVCGSLQTLNTFVPSSLCLLTLICVVTSYWHSNKQVSILVKSSWFPKKKLNIW